MSISHVIKEGINIEPTLSNWIIPSFEISNQTSCLILGHFDQKYFIYRSSWLICFRLAFGIVTKIEAAADGFINRFDSEGFYEDIDKTLDLGSYFYWIFLVLHLKC